MRGATAAPPVIEVASRPGSILLVGGFDGVHRGCVAGIRRVLRCASERALTTTAVVLHDATERTYLTSPERRCELLIREGVAAARTMQVHGDDNRARIRRLLDDVAPVEAVVDPELDASLRLLLVPALSHAGVLRAWRARSELDVASSEAIRRAVARGQITVANRMLGQPHRVPVMLRRRPDGVVEAIRTDPNVVCPASGRFEVVVHCGRSASIADATIERPAVMTLTSVDWSDSETDATVELIARA